MRNYAPSGRRALLALAAAGLCLLSVRSTLAQGGDFYWEQPRVVANARYPLILGSGEEALVFWQESRASGAEAGEAWLSLERRGSGGRTVGSLRRFAGPFPFNGVEPVLYAAASSGKLVIVAASSSERSISIYRSLDGGASFQDPIELKADLPLVAPRLFARADGGWLLFATSGGAADPGPALLSSPADPASTTRDSLRQVLARSADGVSWSSFEQFLSPEDGLFLSFLPSAAPLRGPGSVPGVSADVVVFQSLVAGERPTFQLFSKRSVDGGATWSRAVRVTDFEEPVPLSRRAPADFDNQRAHLASIGGRLVLAWERRILNGQAQAYFAVLDASGAYVPGSAERVSLGQGTVGEPRVVDLSGEPGIVWFDDRRGENRAHFAIREGRDWRDRDISGSRPGALVKAAGIGGKAWAVWQADTAAASAVVLLEPDQVATPPILTGLDFSPGVASRRETVSVRWNEASDPSGIEGYAWIWTRDAEAEPPAMVRETEAGTRQALEADADGPWYFAMKARDFAGNWSETARLMYVRDRSAPSVPLLATPRAGSDGFLLSNTFELSWDPPPEPDLVAYAWTLRYLGPLDKVPPRRRAAGGSDPEASASPAGPDEERPFYAFAPATDYERALFEATRVPLPDPASRSTRNSVAFQNIDDGYYIFAVSSIDRVGNIGDAAWTILRADKFQPYTVVSDVLATRDAFGKASLRLLGRGFLEDGALERIVIDLDGREPYDRSFERSAGDFRIDSDRLVSGLEIQDLPEGLYRVGVRHPLRGWYFTAPRLPFDASGSIKFGDFASTWQASWLEQEPRRRFVLSLTDLMLLAAGLFALVGIVLTSRGALAVAAEGALVRREILALVEGNPMPLADTRKAARRKLRTRGPGLRLKFTLTISLLVLSVVVLLAVPLALFVTATERENMARGLEQRARVLLESVSQGARSYLPTRNLLELGFLPEQARALEESRYVTITGYGQGAGASDSADTVWASNDPAILSRIDTAELQAGESVLSDELSPLVSKAAAEIDAAAQAEVGALAETIAALQAEARGLAVRLDAASQARVAELGEATRELERTLSDKLADIAEAAVGSLPAFDPAALAGEARTFIFYKPVLFRQPGDARFFRGMVRLEVGTELILADIRRAQEGLFMIVGVIALVALGIGLVGAIILSSIIVNPIRRLVEKIEEIRDAEDKATLAGFKIGLKTRDELSILAGTVEEMTHGLVKAAAASKDLTVGKETQKMFIPLEKDGQGNKLTTLKATVPGLEAFGYYEGAKGVSGDYFTFEKLDERHYAFIKCDVAGKGVPAALIMVEVATIFLDYWAGWTPAKGIKLVELCYRINDLVEGRGFKGRFAAFITGVIDARTGVVEVAHAGDKFLHYFDRAAGRIVTRELPDAPTAGSFPNFMVEMKTPYSQVRHVLKPGDVLMLYTDGLEEAQRALRGPKFEELFQTVEVANADGTTSVQEQPRVEYFEPERVEAVSAALMARAKYRLDKAENPVPDEVLSFDFSACSGSVEDLVLALASVEKVFRLTPDPATPESEFVLVDAKIDAFLEAHFEQYRLYARGKRPNPDSSKPEYVAWYGVREDAQYDDLTLLGIEKK